MQRHAAFPELEDIERSQEYLRLVEQAIAEPPADDDAERCIEYEIIGMPPRHRRTRLRDQFQQVPPADQDARDIGKAVPAELEDPQIERNR